MDEMTSLKPMWPAELGTPASSGSSQGVRYTYFPQPRRLVIERDGKRTTYGAGEHQFRGVLQSSETDEKLSFQSQHDRVDLDSLSII
jgi:hypothetical protein